MEHYPQQNQGRYAARDGVHEGQVADGKELQMEVVSVIQVVWFDGYDTGKQPFLKWYEWRAVEAGVRGTERKV